MTPDYLVLSISWLIGLTILFILQAIGNRTTHPLALKGRGGERVGDMIGKTDKAILIITRIIDKETLTFRPIKFEDLPKADCFPNVLALVAEKVIAECLQDSKEWLNDFVAYYDKSKKGWIPKTKKRDL